MLKEIKVPVILVSSNLVAEMSEIFLVKKALISKVSDAKDKAESVGSPWAGWRLLQCF